MPPYQHESGDERPDDSDTARSRDASPWLLVVAWLVAVGILVFLGEFWQVPQALPGVSFELVLFLLWLPGLLVGARYLDARFP